MQHEKIKTILTFDLEFWHSGPHKYLAKDKNEFNDYIEESTGPILNLLDKHKAKATFFVLGELAEKYPELIKKIHLAGHEIASHCYYHDPLEKQSKESFEKQIVSSREILKKITGKYPIGFRAPYFSLNHNTEWCLEILEKYGFGYDSSIFPLRTPLYGVKNAPLEAYKIRKNILEIPVAVLKFGLLKIPLGGGIYFRLLPNSFFVPALKMISRERIPVLYFHPYDLCNVHPEIKSSYRIKKMNSWHWETPKNISIIISYLVKKSWFWGTKRGLKKFERLLHKFEFISIEEYLKTFNG